MKRLTTVFLLLLSLLWTSFLPAKAAPDYSSTDLPLINSASLEVIVNSATSVTFRLNLNITQKVNKVKTVAYRVFVPPKNPLEPPCDFAGGYITAGGALKVINTFGDMVVETTYSNFRLCKGIYGLGEKDGGGASITLTDEADHFVLYATLFSSAQNVKGSNVWTVESAPKPNCPIWWRGNDYWGYEVCGESFNLKSAVVKNFYDLTSDVIAAQEKAAAELKAKQEAEAKAAAELKAKQEADAKAAAELKAKQEAEAKAAAELKAKQEAAAAADKTALVKAQAELTAANVALADSQRVNREQAARISSFEENFKVLSESMAALQIQLSQLNSKLVAALAGLNSANAKLKKVCSAKPKPKGC